MSLVLGQASVIRSGTAVLEDVTLECRAGRFTALCGPNGAGKTTALSLMAGSLCPNRGNVRMDGASLSAMKPIDLARRRAVVAQASPLSFPFHVHEVVEMGRTPHWGHAGRRRDSAIVAAAMEEMELSELGARNYLTLSGGERQRVNIARALAQVWDEPETGGNRWLLLDEPTSALDLRHQIGLLALLRRLAGQGWGIVAVLHDLRLVHEHADEVALFREGRIMQQGEAHTVLSPATIQQAYGLDAPYALTV